ncbi:MAG: hypothetical protein KatS3mg002_0491 [Candidatus Woesearchaeota archaeon]|nr:MAG: hypothetical protein KatS3mg002_0491 [Candidatus Woesearchaeota archaeon]
MLSLLNKKKGQVYIVAVVITIIFALITSFIIIHFISGETKDNYFGMYQAGMINAIHEGNKLLIYVDQVAKYVSEDALQESSKNGFVQIEPESGEDNPGPKCGTYVYNLWNSNTKECFPHINNGFGYFFDSLLNKRLSESEDPNLKKNIERKYYFDSNMKNTKVSAIAEKQYTFYIFKNNDYKEKDEVKNYVSDKQTLEGETFSGITTKNFIWPYDNDFKIISCFGSRNYPGGSEPHPGIDIVASKGTPIKAVASGKVYKIEDSWGAIYIDHGSGLKTVYGHTIKQYVKVGDIVSQGQHIGDTGGRQNYNDNFRGAHLHFEVIYDNIDLMLKYKEIRAVVGNNNDKKRINPLCIYGKEYFENNNIPLIYEKNFGCTNICNPDKNSCADNYVCDTKYGCLFKFCESYGSIIKQKEIECQVNENNDWKITNVMVSKKEVSGDETITITTTIENPSNDCVSVTVKPVFESPGQVSYSYDTDIKYNVYKTNNGKKYLNIETKCTFTTDSNKINSERSLNKCVLLAPKDDKKIKYTVEPRVVDEKKRVVKGNKVTFDVTKPKGVQVTNEIKPTGNIQLSASQQKEIEATRNNLENLKILQYIIETANKENVPPEIVLGLITQESKGKINAISRTGATGLFQVIRSYHEDRVKKECGSWEKFKTDAECQVRVGIGILKQYYKEYGQKGLYMKCGCENNKGTKNCKPIDKKYFGWEAALRAYNSANCHVWADYNFVESIMTYSFGWGYSGIATQVSQYQEVAIDEIESKGIIGKYYVNPSFTVTVPFDISLINNLSIFMNKTVNDCRISQLGKRECLKAKIEEFNNNVGKKYASNNTYVSLTMDCDETKEEKDFNNLIASIEDCALSPDFDCQCDLKKNSNLKITIESDENIAKFKYTKSGNDYEIISYNTFVDSQNNPLIISKEIKDISFIKKLGYLKYGESKYRKCTIPESRYRLCLKTDYKTDYYDGNSLKKKNVNVKFAITIKDNDVPPPIENIELLNMKNSRNSIIVLWNEPKMNNQKIPDIGYYKIYMSDVTTDFDKDINSIKNTLKYRTIDILNTGYYRLKSFDINQEPECGLVDDKYCRFFYKAKDASNNDIKIELEVNKLYYVEDKEKFIYILDGMDSYNALNPGRDKFIAVTAVDLDGNEIDNINESQKITLGKNLKSIKPIDALEPGLTSININIDNVNNKIYLTYNRPEFYINGMPMDNKAIIYRVYANWNCPSLKNESLCDVKPPFDKIAETGDLNIVIDKNQISKIGVVTGLINNNMDAFYMSAFVKDVS